MNKLYIKEYFKNGFDCPYCGAYGTVESINEPENHGISITQDVECLECEKRWKEVYELTKTKKINENVDIFKKD